MVNCCKCGTLIPKIKAVMVKGSYYCSDCVDWKSSVNKKIITRSQKK